MPHGSGTGIDISVGGAYIPIPYPRTRSTGTCNCPANERNIGIGMPWLNNCEPTRQGGLNECDQQEHQIRSRAYYHRHIEYRPTRTQI